MGSRNPQEPGNGALGRELYVYKKTQWMRQEVVVDFLN